MYRPCLDDWKNERKLIQAAIATSIELHHSNKRYNEFRLPNT